MILQKIKKYYKKKILLKALKQKIKIFFNMPFRKIRNHKYMEKLKSLHETESCFSVNLNRKDYLGINLPLLELDERGCIVLPHNCSRIMIDIGTSINWPNSTDWLNRHPNDSTVIGIEPNIDAWLLPKALYFYAEHIDQLKGKSKTYLSKNITNRLLFLPVAIANYDGYATFNSNKDVGTSSLLESDHELFRETIVPTMKLSRLLAKIPDSIKYIEHLKIDAQGFDLEILKSAEEMITKIAVITIEVAAEHEYKYAYSKNDIYNYILMNNFKEIQNSNRYGSVSFINEKYKDDLTLIDYKIRV
tara:strand:+ start:44 stop:952 length:909 start_codon:yes stop_codon:yes gene_type:complete